MLTFLLLQFKRLFDLFHGSFLWRANTKRPRHCKRIHISWSNLIIKKLEKKVLRR